VECELSLGSCRGELREPDLGTMRLRDVKDVLSESLGLLWMLGYEDNDELAPAP
jgi:hypothetical protein